MSKLEVFVMFPSEEHYSLLERKLSTNSGLKACKKELHSHPLVYGLLNDALIEQMHLGMNEKIRSLYIRMGNILLSLLDGGDKVDMIAALYYLQTERNSELKSKGAGSEGSPQK